MFIQKAQRKSWHLYKHEPAFTYTLLSVLCSVALYMPAEEDLWIKMFWLFTFVKCYDKFINVSSTLGVIVTHGIVDLQSSI